MVEAWTALMGELEARKRELGEAVRAYPTPIARCDDQLPKAIACLLYTSPSPRDRG